MKPRNAVINSGCGILKSSSSDGERVPNICFVVCLSVDGGCFGKLSAARTIGALFI